MEIVTLPSDKRLELLEAVMLRSEQVEIPVENIFADGVYMRKGTIPAGVMVIGHQHKTSHLNIVFSGRMSVVMDGVVTEFIGPCVFMANPSVRKVIYAHEDTVMANIHPTDTTDLDLIEDRLIVKSETYQLNSAGLRSEMMMIAEKLMNEPVLVGVKES